MEISIITGDATAVEGFEALVIPANRQLTLGWGSHVAEKVLNAAGIDVEKEALAHHPSGIQCGEAVTTGAGAMKNFTRLIHAAVLDKYDFNPLFLLKLKMRTGPDCLSRAVRSSLEAACAAGITSAVFTPMGSGIGGMKDGMCAEIMLRELRRYEAEHREKNPARVAIACYKEKTAAIFRQELKKTGDS